MELSPHSLTAEFIPSGIRSLINQPSFRPLLIIQCSTPKREHSTLVLKLFRREPAITKLD